MEKMLPDLRKVLAANPKAKATWDDLTPIAHRDFISWIESAKLPETRKRRVDSVPSRLASGKRRPCCYSVVPLGMYSALKKNSKAKATWSALTPDERRNLTDWLQETNKSETQSARIKKACILLAAGEKHA